MQRKISPPFEPGYRTFQEIAERIDDPIMLQDRDGKFQVVNDAVAQYSGLSKQELAGNDEYLLIDSETAEHVQDMKERAISTEEPVRSTVNPDLSTKGDRSFSNVRYPHFDDSGKSTTCPPKRNDRDLGLWLVNISSETPTVSCGLRKTSQRGTLSPSIYREGLTSNRGDPQRDWLPTPEP